MKKKVASLLDRKMNRMSLPKKVLKWTIEKG